MSAVGPSCRRSFSPHGRWLQVPPAQTQATLRQAFTRWGKPRTIRVDNGGPWGASGGDLPPDLALWLIGLGIDMHWNDPRSPQQNGSVERSQGTGKRWAEPGQCATAEELQERLHEFDGIQRDEYPSIAGQSRAEAFPGLRHSGRPYRVKQEACEWDQRRVLQHLSGYVLSRKVNKNGDVWLYHRSHYVGTIHRGKRVFVMVDPHSGEWLFVDDHGAQLRSRPAEELAAERIRSLSVGNRP